MQGNGESAGTPVVWFEVIGKDGGALRSFYGELFGWKTEEFEGMDYGTVSADANGGGIAGGIGSAQEGTNASYQTVYAGVEDVAGTLAKAESLGATTVVPPMDIPNGPTIALFADPQGHTFGLVRPQPSVGTLDRSAAGELGRALLAEGARPFGVVAAARAQLLHGDLLLQRGRQRRLGGRVQHPLRVADGQRRARQQLGHELLGGRLAARPAAPPG